MSSMAQQALLAALERALNGVLALDPATVTALQRFQQQVVALQLRGTGITLWLQLGAGSIHLIGDYDGPVETTLEATPVALLRLASGAAEGALFRGEVTIRGDVELGQRLQRLLRHIDIDWEEHLARLSGDIIAHRIGRLLRSHRQRAQIGVNHLGDQLADWLQYERDLLPDRQAVEGYLQQVDVLRHDSERLAARVARLQQRLPS